MHLVFTVTTDLSFDQRMQRICSSLYDNGYTVTLVGRQKKDSRDLVPQRFHQKRMNCLFQKGFLFYAEYQLRLFVFLLFQKMDVVCAIDLDTILPCLVVSYIRSVRRVYDAHELFTEMKEVRSRPFVHKVWTAVEKIAVPRFTHGYTVSDGLRDEFYKRYAVSYQTIRNIPPLDTEPLPMDTNAFILYQGMVNEGRGFEHLVPAMKKVDHILLVCGEGNFMPQLKTLIRDNGLQEKIILKGLVLPALLRDITRQAVVGINLVEKEGLNQYYSLPNKFFDYVQAGVPQVTMAYPEYKRLNDQYGVAVLLEDLNADAIAKAINTILSDAALRDKLRQNCALAKLELNWEEEEKKLLSFYERIFNPAAV